jgi:hypothetical protein
MIILKIIGAILENIVGPGRKEPGILASISYIQLNERSLTEWVTSYGRNCVLKPII